MKLMVSAPGILALTVGKFSHGGWTKNEADGLDLLLAFLP
jgi:hypothetical protein